MGGSMTQQPEMSAGGGAVLEEPLESAADPRVAWLTKGPLMVLLPMIFVMTLWGLQQFTDAFLEGVEIPYILLMIIFGGMGFLVGLVLTAIDLVLASNSQIKVNPAESMVWVQRGFFSLDHNYVPMQQVVDMDVSQDMLERALGLASVSLTTIRREVIMIRYLKDGMDFSHRLMGAIQKSGGMMRPTGWMVNQ